MATGTLNVLVCLATCLFYIYILVGIIKKIPCQQGRFGFFPALQEKIDYIAFPHRSPKASKSKDLNIHQWLQQSYGEASGSLKVAFI